MTRAQWLYVTAIGVIALVAYNRSGQIARALGINLKDYQPPTAWTA